MHFACKVHRAAPEQRIPTGRIGRAEVLYFQTHAGGSIRDRMADQAFGRIPGRSAGSTPNDFDCGQFPIDNVYLECGGAE